MKHKNEALFKMLINFIIKNLQIKNIRLKWSTHSLYLWIYFHTVKVILKLWSCRSHFILSLVIGCSFAFIHHHNWKMNGWFRTKETISFISYFITGVYCLLSVLPHPLIFSLSCSLFSVTCTHVYGCLHIYIHIFFGYVLHIREKIKIFFCGCATSLNIIHSKYIHFSENFDYIFL